MVNQLAEEWYRQLLAWSQMRRGAIVLFDRHFFADYYAYDIAGGTGRSAARRIHGFALLHLYPKPDLTIYLDAPAEVLLARKGEGTVESLSRRRTDYLTLSRVTPNFAVVDVVRTPEEVVRDVTEIVQNFAATGTVRSQASESS